jgi:hypothetical protein
MFEIWRHIASGQRYLVRYHTDKVHTAAGPLRADDNPVRVLETRDNRAQNPKVLLHMQKAPGAYEREYTTGEGGRVVRL